GRAVGQRPGARQRSARRASTGRASAGASVGARVSVGPEEAGTAQCPTPEGAAEGSGPPGWSLAVLADPDASRGHGPAADPGRSALRQPGHHADRGRRAGPEPGTTGLDTEGRTRPYGVRPRLEPREACRDRRQP